MTLTAAPRIETERLILRGPEEWDFPAFRAFRLSGRTPKLVEVETEGLSWTLFASFAGHWALRGFGRFILEDRATGRTVGHAGGLYPEGWQERELTWSIWDSEFEGRGLAHEAAKAARDHMAHDLGWTTVVSYIDPENARSIALAQRLGAVLERVDPGQIKPFGVWRHPMGALA